MVAPLAGLRSARGIVYACVSIDAVTVANGTVDYTCFSRREPIDYHYWLMMTNYIYFRWLGDLRQDEYNI